MDPVSKLWCAVVLQAIQDYQKETWMIYDPIQKCNAERIRDGAKRWLFASELDGIGSLRWICDNVGLDIGFVRKCAKEPLLRKKGGF